MSDKEHSQSETAGKKTANHNPGPDDPKVVEPSNPIPQITFEQMPEMLRDAATRVGWSSLLPVQARAIPYLLAGRDLMVQSRTGSGKTGAFILPILQTIDPKQHDPQTLILVPTRELAQQVAHEAETLGGKKIQSIAVYGGVGYKKQLDAFRDGVQIVIGTPGRILDHLIKRSLNLKKLKVLVFDEADRMLSMGFYPDMKKIHSFLPSKHVDSYMFSATFPLYVIRLADQFLHKPEILSLSHDHVHVLDTEHLYYYVPAMDKDRALIRIIEMENPDSAIIFCNTKVKVHYVNTVLQRFGYDSAETSADLMQNQREKVMTRLRQGKLRFLVATDLAARGIDIPQLSHVFQYEPPEDHEAYIHRAGRTGRAGAPGVAISLIAGMEQLELQRIARRFKIDFLERELPTDKDVQEIVSQRLTALLEARLRAYDSVQIERMARFTPLAKSLAENEEESPLIAMLLDDYYQLTLHGQPTPIAPASDAEKPSSTPSPRPKTRRRSTQRSSHDSNRKPPRR